MKCTTRYFKSGHGKGAVTHQNNGAAFRVSETRTEGAGDGVPHGCVVAAAVAPRWHAHVNGCEERFTGIKQ